MVATAPNAATNGSLVKLDGVGVDFGRQHVLRDINLTIPRGQTLAIIGESGCGKTVLLKTIIGLLRPSRGAVYFDGRNLAELSERELTQQRIRFGFLFQQAALFDSMTIAQNVSFPLRQHTAKSPDEIRGEVLGPAGRGGAAGEHLGQEAGRAFRRHAQARRSGPGPGHGARRSCSTTSRPRGSTRSWAT